jgi:hypothetical protein
MLTLSSCSSSPLQVVLTALTTQIMQYPGWGLFLLQLLILVPQQVFCVSVILFPPETINLEQVT